MLQQSHRFQGKARLTPKVLKGIPSFRFGNFPAKEREEVGIPSGLGISLANRFGRRLHRRAASFGPLSEGASGSCQAPAPSPRRPGAQKLDRDLGPARGFLVFFFWLPFFSPPRITGGGSLQRTSRPRLHVLLRKEDSGETNARNRQVRNRSMLTHASQPRQFRWALFWGYPFGKPTEHV